MINSIFHLLQKIRSLFKSETSFRAKRLDMELYRSPRNVSTPHNVNISEREVNWLLENNTLENTSFYNVSNYTNFGISKEPIPLGVNETIQILMTCFYAAITVVGILGNIGVIVVVVQNRLMHTATNYYLCSMALSDLLLLITGMPHELFILWSVEPYIFGLTFCVLRGLTAELSTNASILTIVAFTVERYIGICHPLRSHVMSHLGRVIKFIFTIWFMAFLFALPQCVQYGITEQGDCAIFYPLPYTFEVSTILFFIVPMTLITVLYVKIGIEMRRSQHLGRYSSTARDGTVAVDRSRSVIKMLVAVVVAFFICFAPFHAQRLVAFYGDPESETHRKIYHYLTNVSGITFYLSTCINPVLYHILSRRFRQAFKETIRKYCISCRCYRCVNSQSSGSLHSNESSKRIGSTRSLSHNSASIHNRRMSTDSSRFFTTSYKMGSYHKKYQNGLQGGVNVGKKTYTLGNQSPESSMLTINNIPKVGSVEKIHHHTWV
ncbi:UNVERIFIED_CONTAM: hypothetical protein RMT77_009982 [Armadillidium vulgare]